MDNKEFGLLSFWSLNSDLKKEEIINQIEDMHQKGYYGFFLHARAGLTLKYLSDEWFDICETAIITAERLGMTAWLYDENGWPSGFAGGLVPSLGDDYTAKHLYFTERKPKNDLNTPAVYRKNLDGSYNRIEFSNSKDGDLFCCIGRLSGYADLLNPKAVAAFIGFTHEKYKERFSKYFGKTVKGIFTDEPQCVGKFAYTFKFAELFKEKYNLDFFDGAWQLYSDEQSSSRFKYLTSKLLSVLFCESFTKQINDWCNKNNLVFTGHFSNEDGLCDQVRANFNLMNHYDNMGQPGIDFLGRRLTSPVLVKQVSDAAFINGKKMITSESFGCCGWDVTFNDLMWIASYQAVFGINSIVTHLSAYSMKGRRKRDYPAFYSYQEPWWDSFKSVADKIKEINTFLADGQRRPKTAVIFPVSSMWCLNGGTQLRSDASKEISNQFRLLCENLIDLQKDFVILTEDNLLKLECNKSCLVGEYAEFDTIIVPQSVSLEKATYELLNEYSINGGRVVFINNKPYLCEGEASNLADGITAETVQNRRGLLEKYYLFYTEKPEIELIDPFSKRTACGIMTAVRFNDSEIKLMVFNPSRSDDKKLLIKVKGEKKVFLIANGDKKELSAMYDGRFTYSKIDLSATETSLFVVQDGKPNSILNKKHAFSQISDFKVYRMEKNVLTIDKCDIYLDNELIYENCNPVKVTDELYDKIASKKGNTTVRLLYRFNADFKVLPSDFSVAAECEEGEIIVNGIKIFDSGKYFVDKSIHIFDSKSALKNGINTVEFSFEVQNAESYSDTEFEGYRNIFFYDTEPESIYLLGDFSVDVKGDVFENDECFITGSEFCITDSKELSYDEFTHQGLWFYNGSIRLTGEFVSNSKKTIIAFQDFAFTCAQVFINKKYAGTVFSAPFKLEVSKYTNEGNNEIEIIIRSGNRNTFGPHHHIALNPHFVGVTSFKEEKGFTDFIYPEIKDKNTGISEYTFVKFSANCILSEDTDL